MTHSPQEALDRMGGLVGQLQDTMKESMRADEALRRSRPTADRELESALSHPEQSMDFARIRRLVLILGANPSAPKHARMGSPTLLMDALGANLPFEALRPMLEATTASDAKRIDAMGWNLAHFAQFHTDARVATTFGQDPKFRPLLSQTDAHGRLPRIRYAAPAQDAN